MTETEIDWLRQLPAAPQSLFIGGQFTPALDGAEIDVISPIDGRLGPPACRGCGSVGL